MRFYIGILIAVACLTGTAFTATASESLIVAGTGDSQVLLRELAAAYEKTHGDIDIVVPDSVGSGGGIKAVAAGTAGLARTARALKPEERQQGLTEIPFAWSPVVFAANPSAAMVKNLNSDDVIRIYNGTITNWRRLGGDDHKIYPVDREPGDSSRDILEAGLKSSSGTFKEIQSVGKVFFTTPDTVQALFQNRYTLGYLPLPMALAAQLHIFSVDSVFPDQTNVQNRRYPLVTTFYLVAPSTPDRTAAAFLSFVQEPSAREIMRAAGVVPVESVSR